MSETKVVASFRALETNARPFVERARALIGGMVPLGAEHVGWDALKLTFAFDPSDLPVLFDAIADAGGTTQEGEQPWAIGLAHGEVAPIREAGSPLTSSGVIWYGPALVEASSLADVARPGELLAAPSVPELRDGQLATSGFRIAHVGTLRLRGTRIDPRQPWRTQARSNLSRLRAPALVTSHLPPLAIAPGSVVVVRADPGGGGTRLLSEATSRAPHALFISPSGSGYEPLGALRCAIAKLDPPEVDPTVYHALLAGRGITVEQAATLIGTILWPASATPGGPAGVLALDDAKSIDPATLDACVLAAEMTPAFGIIARLDATNSVPAVLATLPAGGDHELALVAQEDAEAIAASITGDMLDAAAKRRWARLGAGVPLAIVEAVAHGVGSGQIVWNDNAAHPRSRSAGRGKARRASKWIRRRANAEETPERAILSLVAVLGGETHVGFIERTLEKASLTIDVEPAINALVERRWLTRTTGGHVAFPSRTHRDALFTAMEDDARKRLHLAIARVIEAEDGVFGKVEAAWHLAQAGEAAKASALLLEGARAAAIAHLETSTTQLIAYARRIDPSCEEAALELLADALEAPAAAELQSVDIIEAAPASTVVSVPLDAPNLESGPPPSMVPSQAPGSQIAVRLGELAKEALLAADNVALEKWVDGLHAAGESPAFTERMRAMARLNRGEIGDALRVLRRARSLLDPTDHRQRCQTSLALGVALSVAGRPQEALLEGMDALARARQIDDAHGAKACLAFLAKLYGSVDRESEAKKLQQVG